jgi:hypothetical protein
MGDVLKWVVVGLIVLVAWRWWQSGGVQATLGPQYGFGGGQGYQVRPPAAGWTVMGPGIVAGFDPQTWGAYQNAVASF